MAGRGEKDGWKGELSFVSLPDDDPEAELKAGSPQVRGERERFVRLQNEIFRWLGGKKKVDGCMDRWSGDWRRGVVTSLGRRDVDEDAQLVLPSTFWSKRLCGGCDAWCLGH